MPRRPLRSPARSRQNRTPAAQSTPPLVGRARRACRRSPRRCRDADAGARTHRVRRRRKRHRQDAPRQRARRTGGAARIHRRRRSRLSRGDAAFRTPCSPTRCFRCCAPSSRRCSRCSRAAEPRSSCSSFPRSSTAASASSAPRGDPAELKARLLWNFVAVPLALRGQASAAARAGESPMGGQRVARDAALRRAPDRRRPDRARRHAQRSRPSRERGAPRDRAVARAV